MTKKRKITAARTAATETFQFLKRRHPKDCLGRARTCFAQYCSSGYAQPHSCTLLSLTMLAQKSSHPFQMVLHQIQPRFLHTLRLLLPQSVVLLRLAAHLRTALRIYPAIFQQLVPRHRRSLQLHQVVFHLLDQAVHQQTGQQICQVFIRRSAVLQPAALQDNQVAILPRASRLRAHQVDDQVAVRRWLLASTRPCPTALRHLRPSLQRDFQPYHHQVLPHSHQRNDTMLGFETI